MIVSCKNCDKDFNKIPSQIKKGSNNFCSRSCSATYNNKKYPKRKQAKEWKCKRCGCDTPHRRTVCDNCYTPDYTLGEAIYADHHKSSAYAKVRSRARTIAKKEGWTSCCECGYNKHVEIAHIKPISEFELSTKLSVINDPSNLKPLCPNCHWEFDNK